MSQQDSEFVTYLLEQLESMDGVRSGRMFGGHAIYKNDLAIGLVFQDAIYLKVDDRNRGDFEKAGSKPFTYEKGGKAIIVSNWEVPADVLEDQDTFIEWAEKSYAVAVDAKK